MKKLFISMVVASASLISGTACAQADSQNNNSSAQTEQGMKAKKDKGVHKADKKRGERGNMDPFNGIDLTAEQKQQLQVLRQGIGPVMPQSYEKNDSTKKLTNEQKQQMRQERAARINETKKNYLGGLKQILTPEQYVIFLENVYIYGNPDQQPGNMKKEKKIKSPDGKGERKKGEFKAKKSPEKRK